VTGVQTCALPIFLYNLPAVLRAKQEGEPIWVVEGEKDANTLIDLGICATTMPGGAGKWLDIHTAALAGAVVEIVADNDGPGKNHALKVLNELTNASCSVQAWICPEKKDITDHLSSGGKIEQLLPFEDVGENQQVEDREAPSEQASELEPEVGLKELAIARASEIITRDDLRAQQNLSKLSLVLSATRSSCLRDLGLG
jgi:DNA primase